MQLSTEERFNKAVKISDKINRENMTEADLGKMYGLYKQSMFGNCNISKCPNKITDYVNYKKWHNWSCLTGKSKESAMNEYADSIIDMVDKYGLKSAAK